MFKDEGHRILEELLDREAIRDCLHRAALSNDICDTEMWKSIYWPDGSEDHGYYKGNAHEFVDTITPIICKAMDATWHHLGNVIIRLGPDNAATVVTYAFVYCRMVHESGSRWDLLAGVRYLDHFKKRGSEWRISDRVTKTDWMREATDSLDWARIDSGTGKPMPLGMRSPQDALFTLFSQGDLTCLRNGLTAKLSGS